MKDKGLIYSNQLSMFGKPDVVGYSNGKLYVSEIERDLSNELIKEHHYSHKVYNGTYIHLGVYIDEMLVGVLQYGYAMNPASCDSAVEGTDINQYLELNRMWLDDVAARNSESMAISCSIVYIKHRYPKIKWIQSFADERCNCFGIVYQACSFSYYGEHNSIFWECGGEVFHNSIKTSRKAGKRGYDILNSKENKDKVQKYELRQFRYIKFLDMSWKNKCRLKEIPYPKYYKEA